MQKLLLLTLLGISALFLDTACRTAHHVAEDSVDLGAHAVRKTGHAVEHGVDKMEKHL